MLKRFGLSCALYAISSICVAGTVYIGPMVQMETTTAVNSNYRGIAPRITFGYDQELDSLYHISAEIFATPTSILINSNTSPGAHDAKTTRSFGLSIIPAYLFGDIARAYARLGIVQTKFSGPNSNATGAQIGIGAQVKIESHWDLRAEYSYEAYRTISDMGSPKSDIFGIGLVTDLNWLLG